METTAQDLILSSQVNLGTVTYEVEREILRLVNEDKNFHQLKADEMYSAEEHKYRWLEITQVGKMIDEDPENRFSAIQNIIQAGNFGPDSTLAFYIKCSNGVFKIYLGLHNHLEGNQDADMFKSFAKKNWPGLEFNSGCEESMIVCNDETKIYALTGIPSLKKQSDKFTFSTIDKFLSGISNQEISFLVIAKPIIESDIVKAANEVRNISGNLEGFKKEDITKQKSSSVSDDKAPNDDSKDTKNSIRQLLAQKMIPIWGQINAPYFDKELSNYISKATSTSHSESRTRSIVNKNIEAAISKLDKFAERIDECKGIGAWETGVYLLSDDDKSALNAATQLKSLVSGIDSEMEPIRIFDISNVVYDAEGEKGQKTRSLTIAKVINPTIHLCYKNNGEEFYHSAFGDMFNHLTTILSSRELAYYINFPMHSIPGISVVDCAPDFCLSKPSDNCGMKFGKLIDNGVESSIDYVIPHQCLSRHTLVAGITGSGKTNTIKSILTNNNSNIPFLIIEPAKTEYVDWAIKYNETHKKDPITIFMPGCKTYKNANLSQLKLNPFEIVWLDKKQTPYTLSHIDRLKSIFASAFPMQDILPVLMEELIYAIYQASTTCWIGEKAHPIYGQTLFPTLNGMSIAIDNVISNRRYEDKVQMNMAACLHTRVDNLKRGWRGDVLNNPQSTDWKELFEKPCIINLSYVGDETDKAFLTSLILLFMYEYRIAQHDFEQHNNDSKYKTTENDICKHISIVEEAHRVMSKCDDTENPRYKSATLFSNMLSEIRAYGEGMVLVDQVPTRLIPDAIKNTNLKILHRLVSTDDVKALGEAMGLSDEQMKLVPKLKIGDCIVTSSANLEPYWIHATKI